MENGFHQFWTAMGIIEICTKKKKLNPGSKLHPVDHGGDRHHWKRHAGGDHHPHVI